MPYIKQSISVLVNYQLQLAIRQYSIIHSIYPNIFPAQLLSIWDYCAPPPPPLGTEPHLLQWVTCIQMREVYRNSRNKRDCNRVLKIIQISLRRMTFHYTWKCHYWNIITRNLQTRKTKSGDPSLPPRMMRGVNLEMRVTTRRTTSFKPNEGFHSPSHKF